MGIWFQQERALSLCIQEINGNSIAYFVFYVDDILLIRNDDEMLGDIKFPKTYEEFKRILDIRYASAVGSIQYVVQCTRPDVAYALSVTSKYEGCAGETHWSTIKTILKYLKRTKDMFLVYDGGELILEGYSDASFQSGDDDAKSQSGFVFMLNGGVVA
ncbi:UNVERIFIED_CONTAM: Retrovirus-related Pol polyprotein from transposon TNT 1-94 [Sesamum angustifolium]|uniref:Retrovirus-related Pol polyprotein from transposon TNT 1-94 n=1 Tax=Sesamum angustifolium TaxID=2727405 RepID=A0AAW2ILC4_9LAMI